MKGVMGPLLDKMPDRFKERIMLFNMEDLLRTLYAQ